MQLLWKHKRFPIPIYDGYWRNFWVQLECLGAWTCHPAIKTKSSKSAFEKNTETWVVTHVTTGKALVKSRTEVQARRIVEFLAARWPKPVKLVEDKETLEAMRLALEQAREAGELLFWGGREEVSVLKKFEDRELEKQLIEALCAPPPQRPSKKARRCASIS